MGHNGNVADSLGIYISVPFCKAKCSFCNFASGVFAQEGWGRYLQRVVDEVHEARAHAAGLDVAVPERVDSIYLGGGTPSLLEPSMLRELFAAVHGEFTVETDAEVTAECATGQLSDATLLAMQDAGVNRLSFGVQSFVDREAATVGRTHTGSECLQELRRTTAAGIARVGIDLICGLPGQTEASWRFSINEALASGVEHVSVYMLEVDDGSRLGRESLQGGDRYGAGELPEDDAVAAWYGEACARLEAGGLRVERGHRATIAVTGSAVRILGLGWMPTRCCVMAWAGCAGRTRREWKSMRARRWASFSASTDLHARR
jgi:oxygen-independent coproporphyrinogen-3 oxidase